MNSGRRAWVRRRANGSCPAVEAPGQIVRRFLKSEDGVTAIEFAILATPFFVFVFGIMAIGLQFFTINSLDHAVEVAARKIRTGEAQTKKDSSGNTMTIAKFRDLICDAASNFIERDCATRLRVHIQSAAQWANIVPRPCAQAGNMTNQVGNANSPVASQSGGAGQVVLVTVCYDWQLPVQFPFLNRILMKPADGIPLQSGGSLIQSVATFRTEPYE